LPNPELWHGRMRKRTITVSDKMQKGCRYVRSESFGGNYVRDTRKEFLEGRFRNI
jgi:hypothetical protein